MEESNQIQYNNIQYPDCEKDSYHLGERVNMICIDPECDQNDKIGCCACMEIDHINHQYIPVKLLLHSSQKTICSNESSNLNCEEILESIEICRQQIINLHQENIAYILEKAQGFEKQYNNYFDGLKEMIKKKSSCQLNQQELNQILDKFYYIQDNNNNISFKENVNKFISFMELQKQNLKTDDISEAIWETADQIKKQTQSVRTQYDKFIDDINKELTDITSNFQLPENNSEASLTFKFGKLKHSDIIIINPTTVSSKTNNGYKFGLLEPQLPKNKKTSFAFKINKKGQSDWMAVGICHKKTVEKKNYTWSTPLGHGGYLISSQAYSWSTLETDKNSKYISFPFVQGDQINCEFDPIKKTITYMHEKTKKKCTLNFKLDDGDPLHPCVLFYYNNYEVEFKNKVH